MPEYIVYRYMKHVPQIWGVQYPKILGIVIGAGLLIGIGQVASSTNIGKILSFAAGAVAACAGYVVCLMQEKNAALSNKDELPFVRARLTSQCGLEGFIVITTKKQEAVKKQSHKGNKSK